MSPFLYFLSKLLLIKHLIYQINYNTDKKHIKLFRKSICFLIAKTNHKILLIHFSFQNRKKEKQQKLPKNAKKCYNNAIKEVIIWIKHQI